MSEFEICYTEHELKYVRVDARNKKEAERKFHIGEIEWDAAKGYGDYSAPTLNKIEEVITP